MGRNILDIRAAEKPSGTGRQGTVTVDNLRERGGSIKGMAEKLTTRTATRRTTLSPTCEWSLASLTAHAKRTLVEEAQGGTRVAGGYDGL